MGFHSLASYIKQEEVLEVEDIIYPSISRFVVDLTIPIDLNSCLLISHDG